MTKKFRPKFSYSERLGSGPGLLLFDLALLSIMTLGVYAIRTLLPISGHIVYPFSKYIPFFVILITSWLLFMAAFGMYGRRVDQPMNFFRALVRVNYNFIILVSISTFVLRVTTTNRTLLLLFLISTNAIITVTHGAVLLKRSKSYAILGFDLLACSAGDAAKEHFALRGANFAGFLSPGVQYGDFLVERGLPILGTMEHMLSMLSKYVDCIIIALPADFPDKQRLVDDLNETGIKIFFAYHIPERVELVSS